MNEKRWTGRRPAEQVRGSHCSIIPLLRKTSLRIMLWPNGEQSLGEIKIGDPFPKSDLILGDSRTAWTMLSGPTLVFLIVIPKLTGRDVPGFNESPIKFGLAWDKGLVHLLMDFSGWLTAEAPMDPYLHTESENQQFISAGGSRQNVPVVLIESPGDLVRGIRVLPLQMKIADQIRHLYKKSADVHLSQRSVHRSIESTEEVSHPEPGDLFGDRTVMCQLFN